MNNLQIISNTTVPSINISGSAEEILLQEQLMSRNSGGYMGIFVENGASSFNNLNIGFAVIGIMHNGYGEKVETTQKITSDINYVKIHNSWANSIYTRNGTLILDYTEISASGGPAIHSIDDVPSNSINPHVVINDTTTINNWVSGEEAWFKAYGMSSTALLLKANIDLAISATNRSIISMINNPVSGLPSEMINLILLTEPSNAAKTEDEDNLQITGSQNDITINGKMISRPWNILKDSLDPRVDQGRFIFPIGIYSTLSDFGQISSYIGSQISDKAQLGHISSANAVSMGNQLGMLAAFYNLTQNDINGILNKITQPSDTLANAFGMYLYENMSTISPAKYLEILSPMPTFSNGYATIIIELVNKE